MNFVRYIDYSELYTIKLTVTNTVTTEAKALYWRKVEHETTAAASSATVVWTKKWVWEIANSWWSAGTALNWIP